MWFIWYPFERNRNAYFELEIFFKKLKAHVGKGLLEKTWWTQKIDFLDQSRKVTLKQINEMDKTIDVWD